MAKIVHIGEFSKVWNEEGIALALEKLGQKVIRLEESAFNYKAACGVVETENPDLVLMAKLKTHLGGDREAFMRWVKGKVKTVSWVFDLYYGLSREYKVGLDAIFKCDLFLSPDGGHDEWFEGKGVTHKLLRQGIHDEFCYKSVAMKEYDYDVVFVGTKNGQWRHRQNLCAFLSNTYGKRFKWFGRTEDDKEIRGHDLNALYASAKVVVGDSVYSPYYFSNRIYETLGRGGFLIHPMIEGLDKEYEPYKHFIPYKFGEFGSLKEKIDYFLTKDDERKKISDLALEHTKKNHTLINRCEQFLTMI